MRNPLLASRGDFAAVAQTSAGSIASFCEVHLFSEATAARRHDVMVRSL